MKKTFLVIIFLVLFPLQTKAEMKANPFYYNQGYLSKINLYPYVWSKTIGTGVTVAVIDSGVWLQHPDLVGANWVNSKEIPSNGIDDDRNGYIDDYYGWNFVDNNHDLTAKSKHGTMVAGIIAAQDNDLGIVGISPGSKIMPLIVCDSEGCYDKNIIDSIYYAVNNGAKVINLSLGATNGYVGYSDVFNDAVKYAYSKDVVIIAAAGNGDPESFSATGNNLSFLKISPVNNDVGGINMILGVGALDSINEKTYWTNYGLGVDVSAPGEGILSTTVPVYSDGFGYDSGDGTSFSAPIVSATAALLRSMKPNLKNWEVIDYLSKKSVINVDNILTEGIDKCEIISFNTDRYKDDDLIKVSAKNVTSDLVLYLQNKSGTISLPIRKDSYNFIDAKNFEINLKKLSLSPDSYHLEEESGSCIARNISFVIEKDSGNNFLVNSNKGIVEDKPVLSSVVIDRELSQRLKGKILLQVESHGEAWYVNPINGKRYYMADGKEAFNIMRNFGVGITNQNLERIMNDLTFAKKNSGKIFLKVEDKGQAYYINFDGKAHYLKDGNVAYDVMRTLGVGITNSNLLKIEI